MTNEAQFGIIKTLRPFTGFEAIYQGNPAVTIPIMFTELGVALDPDAGKPGFSPTLLRGLTVPMGANVIIWLPYFFGITVDQGISVWFYNWRIMWRLRNTFDYRTNRVAYHYPAQAAGAPDTSTFPPERVIIPAAVNPIIYTQTQPVFPNLNNTTSRDRIDIITPATDGSPGTPFIPGGGLGQYQQGLLDPATAGTLATRPIYIPYSVTALGDELLIGVNRNAAPSAGASGDVVNWSFNIDEVDNVFSDLFGNGQGQAFPDVGVYVSTGASS